MVPITYEFEETFDFNNANYSLITNRLQSINWESILDNCDINHAVNTFYDTLNDIIHQTIPKKRSRRMHYSKNPPWFSKELINLKNKKQKAHKK